MITLEIPKWCKKQQSNFFHAKRCCICESSDVYHQEGDGKRLHSLCRRCHKKVLHFCKGKKVWKDICNECSLDNEFNSNQKGVKKQ